MKFTLLPLVVLLCALAGCASRASKLPYYDKVPAFTATDSLGRSFSRAKLDGKVWIADFIYTTCPAECPMMTAKMHTLEERLQEQPGIQLVSFSVDPEHDTPTALTQFAQRYGGANDRWHFLTSSPETVHLLAYKTFHVGDVIGKMQHSTNFALVDRHGSIRGYYSSLDQGELDALVRDAEAL